MDNTSSIAAIEEEADERNRKRDAIAIAIANKAKEVFGLKRGPVRAVRDFTKSDLLKADPEEHPVFKFINAESLKLLCAALSDIHVPDTTVLRHLVSLRAWHVEEREEYDLKNHEIEQLRLVSPRYIESVFHDKSHVTATNATYHHFLVMWSTEADKRNQELYEKNIIHVLADDDDIPTKELATDKIGSVMDTSGVDVTANSNSSSSSNNGYRRKRKDFTLLDYVAPPASTSMDEDMIDQASQTF